ncbi:hypothetical protein Micbo1qcDRAFT_172163 [Microdochium bolleyi]|uniref:F-box domain-containing protein n=1 Tax=Microdochium bolleyi TaxID=196109 RepID=A0A136JFC8_9PEZI|nr:hypothetical protein Micbo1qcDRAFT_172163 [Microdochium bolleyi]
MATSDIAADASTRSAAGAVAPGPVVPGSVAGDTCTDTDRPTASQSLALPVILKHLKGKEAEWDTISRRDGPLGFLDLPIDVLGLVVREVHSHNDLLSLALTNSTLYNLAIPLIYCNFDIVWPDDSSSSSPSTGVDALTYGLATLCLGSRFAQRTRWLRGSSLAQVKPSRRLASNQYATYVRKFSIGNGKESEVAEFSVGQDSGKMLGTLVALAVAKMVNLETFVWDMPTGVLSDVFMALASLQDHYPDGQHKLTKIWIRWHTEMSARPASTVSSGYVVPNEGDILNFFAGVTPQPSSSTSSNNLPLPPHLLPKESPSAQYAECKVEYPTFSILPALESLTVLDVTEVAYLDEISQLIERSRSVIRELRLGLGSSASAHVINWLCDGDKFHQVDLAAAWPGESQIGDKRLGGVLGVVFGRIFDLNTQQFLPGSTSTERTEKIDDMRTAVDTTQALREIASPEEEAGELLPPADDEPAPTVERSDHRSLYDGTSQLRLRLRVFELEKLAISVQICQKAIDWTSLTTLTILDCTQHESLWRMLRKTFQVEQMPASVSSRQYPLSLKNIHVDNVSSSLMTFLKETLAPNSLESLFLQARRTSGQPAVRLSAIMKGPIRRHRSSLRKLLLDSIYFRREPVTTGLGRSHWAMSSSWVSYLTSGRMTNLRELSVSFDARAWHPFLRGFPNIPELRTLHVLGLPSRTNQVVQKEKAVQIADVLTLRPDSKLCYFGIGNACFEIMEAHTERNAPPDIDLSGHVAANGVIVVDPGTEIDSSLTSSSESETIAAPPPPPPPIIEMDGVIQENPDDWSSQHSSTFDSDADSCHGSDDTTKKLQRWLYLHQIPFCDDKIDIFKARHGRLGGAVEPTTRIRLR